MKTILIAFNFIFLTVSNVNLFAQPKVEVLVHPGTELMGVIHLLSDSAYIVNSTYRKNIEKYFSKFKNDPAIQKARKLPFINCDFPVRLSWAFHDFPNLKLSQPDSLLGYEKWFKKNDIQDYLSSCLNFYKRSDFKRFYYSQKDEYKAWVASFDRNLYENDLLVTINDFYKFLPTKKIVITLGSLNCGTYVIPDIESVNPNLHNTTVIMVAYGNIIRDKAAETLHPSFYNPLWASQLVWHEMGHAYLSELFKQYKIQVDGLEYISEQDSSIKKNYSTMGWSMYLNENLTQAVTSFLRIETKKIDRDIELVRIGKGSFNVFVPKLIDIIKDYYSNRKDYKSFKEFFPILLEKLRQEYKE